MTPEKAKTDVQLIAMKMPDLLFVRTKNNVLLDTSFVPTDGSITYICKDVVEKIIKSALGPQDALNKIHSL